MKRVYFIRPVGMEGPVKIGCSQAPGNRREVLETWSPFPLEIVAEVEGDFDLERRFHALFIETHQRREWFGWSKRMATIIAAINDGSFDPATLPAPMCVAHMHNGKRTKKRKPRSPQQVFSHRFLMRYYRLQASGMPRAECEGVPLCYGYAPPSEFLAIVDRCEAFINAATIKYLPHLPAIHFDKSPMLLPIPSPRNAGSTPPVVLRGVGK